MESQVLLDYVIKVTASVYIGQALLCGRRNPPPQPLAPSVLLISSVIFSLISHHYRLILPQYAAIVLSFHISHSDIAFVVKFKFSERLSEISGGVQEQSLGPRRRRRCRRRPWPPAAARGRPLASSYLRIFSFMPGLFIWAQR